MERSKIAIVIPAFNESATISAVVTAANQYGITIVVDDASTDSTAELAARHGAIVVTHAKNVGYDGALNSGFIKAVELGCQVVVTVDADGQHEPSLVQRFIDALEAGADVVVGVRNRRQRFAEHIFAWYTKLRYGINDPLCGLKAYKIKIFEALGHFDSYESIGTELMIYAAKKGYQLAQLPFDVRERTGPSKFGRALSGNIKIFNSMIHLVRNSTVYIFIAMVITLYLSPAKFKYFAADIIATVIVLGFLILNSKWKEKIGGFIKPVSPILALLAYAMLQDLVLSNKEGVTYFHDNIYSLIPYFMFYILFKNVDDLNLPSMVLAVLIVPGLVHVGYMYFDIYIKIQNETIILGENGLGFMENIKEAPRVGRRYVSMALLHMLCGAILIKFTPFSPLVKLWGSIFLWLGIFSLALLDARAAYVSVFLACLLLLITIGPQHTWIFCKMIIPNGVKKRAAIVIIILTVLAIGYDAGKSRWHSMAYSIKTAAHDVYDDTQKKEDRHYVSSEYWNEPIDDKCFSEINFRCSVDQSAYLRFSWLITGLQSLIINPFGLGYSNEYFGHLWGVLGDKNKYQQGDSFLSQHIVSFGVPGVSILMVLVLMILWEMRNNVRTGPMNIYLLGIGGLLIICVCRALVDVLNEGLWRYFMALLGMFYGLAHSNNFRDSINK